MQPFWLEPDDNLLAWSGAIHLQKKGNNFILAVNCHFTQYNTVTAPYSNLSSITHEISSVEVTITAILDH